MNEKLQELKNFTDNANQCYLPYRYHVTLECTRRVWVPFAGSQAYTYKTLRGDWTYGKHRDFKSSKAAVEYLTKKIQPYLTEMSDCTIIVWNGYSGIEYEIKRSYEKFGTGF